MKTSAAVMNIYKEIKFNIGQSCVLMKKKEQQQRSSSWIYHRFVCFFFLPFCCWTASVNLWTNIWTFKRKFLYYQYSYFTKVYMHEELMGFIFLISITTTKKRNKTNISMFNSVECFLIFIQQNEWMNDRYISRPFKIRLYVIRSSKCVCVCVCCIRRSKK